MESLLDRMIRLEKEHDRLDPELVARKRVKLGLRNPDGTGVVVGITSKGQVMAFRRDRSGKNIPIPGKLIYCGIDVLDIVENIEREQRFGFEETAYLLLTGELPSSEDLEEFKHELSACRPLPELAKFITKFNSENDDQMGALHTAVALLSKFDSTPRSNDIRDVTRQSVDLIGKFPTIIARNYAALQSKKTKRYRFTNPDPSLGTAESFLYMLQGKLPSPEVARAFDIMLVLHAEHGGGNNSTFTVRTVTSTLTDTYMVISAGIASLAGHLHGGANEAVMRMMDDIKDNVKDWNDDGEVSRYLEGIVDKRNGDGSGKIFGLGHPVYIVSDPREPILRKMARKFAEKAGRMDEFDLYDSVARLGVEVIKKKKGKDICANVDFHSGFIYNMMGIPSELYTPIFALSRVTGWCAHRIEEIIQGRIIRPAYVSSLKGITKYTPIDKRQ